MSNYQFNEYRPENDNGENENNGYASTDSSTSTSNNQYGSTDNTQYNSTGYNQYSNQYNSQTGSQYTSNPYAQPPKKKERKPHPKAKFVGKVVAAALIFSAVAGPATYGANYLTQKATGIEQTTTADTGSSSSNSSKNLSSTSAKTSVITSDVSDIVDETMPSIVQVTNMSIVEYQDWFGQTTQVPQKSAGSGIIFDEDDNYIYIATNNHVVSNSNSITITFSDDSSVSGDVQGTDEETDLAVVKVKKSDINSSTLKTIKVATLGDSSTTKVGEAAIVIGNALGYGQSVSTGVISALNREVSIENEDTGKTYTNYLTQTDAAVNPGNSGGALLNANGEVIGIVSAKYSDESVEGMGYAIPISNAKSMLEQLMNDGKVTDRSSMKVEDNSDSSSSDSDNGSTTGTAYLGIAGVDITSDMASQYNMPEGVYVAKVTSGSAADNAGIKKGDVITGVNGTTITTMSELKSQISSMNAGDKATISVATVENNYKSSDVEVTLGSQPDSSSDSSDGSDNSGSSDGSSGSDNSGSSNDSGSDSGSLGDLFGLFGNN